ncbi:MAG: 2-oxoglutarate dehydrogenase complex dihydrolipoyllysine-residue succinyltransferase [Myxococcota bacterium]
MAVELKVPSAGESITEVTIVEWLKDEGAYAELDETIAVIETDKANVDVNAPVAGTIQKIIKGPGDAAEVGEVIGMMEQGDRPAAAAAVPAPLATPIPGPPPTPAAAPLPPTPASAPEPADGPIPQASPSLRRLIRENKIDVTNLSGSGPGGRIVLADLRQGQAEPEGGSRAQERVAMTSLRKRIAERLVQSQSEGALLTTFNEVDMGAVMTLRKAHQEAFVAKHGIKLGFMSFFVKAAVEALKEFPQINAFIDGDAIVYNDYYDVGVAVGGGRGLVVPVIRNAERLSFAQVEKTIADFGTRAKANRLQVEELQGGTFTISNGGIYGSLMSTPIINPPQSGILGMHAIQDRPVVKDGQVVVAKMMYLALTYDHRLVDGREAVSFLVRIKNMIESPSRMLLEV